MSGYGGAVTSDLMILRRAEGPQVEVVPVGTELFNSRVLFVEGAICDEGASKTIKGLLALEKEDPEAPVTLVVNSPGGSVTAGLALIDTMRSVSCPVHTVGMGMIASMAAVILACGDHRAVYPNAQVMIHQLLGGLGMSQQSDIEIAAEQLRNLRGRLDALLAEKGKLSIEEFHELTERDCWCDAERALELGIVDEIVPRKGR